MFTTLHSFMVLRVELPCCCVGTVQFRKQGFIAVILLMQRSRVLAGVLLSRDIVQFQTDSSLAKAVSSARAEPKLAKMLKGKTHVCCIFCSDSRLAFPRSDNTSLSFITLMFTTLHSLTVLWVVLSCYSVDAVQFRKQGFIALMFTTLHCIHNALACLLILKKGCCTDKIKESTGRRVEMYDT